MKWSRCARLMACTEPEARHQSPTLGVGQRVTPLLRALPPGAALVAGVEYPRCACLVPPQPGARGQCAYVRCLSCPRHSAVSRQRSDCELLDALIG